jgi:hypothetical protein
MLQAGYVLSVWKTDSKRSYYYQKTKNDICGCRWQHFHSNYPLSNSNTITRREVMNQAAPSKTSDHSHYYVDCGLLNLYNNPNAIDENFQPVLQQKVELSNPRQRGHTITECPIWWSRRINNPNAIDENFQPVLQQKVELSNPRQRGHTITECPIWWSRRINNTTCNRVTK